eukprot:1158495-Pelagomonas_calceolata.AAC.8
MEGRIDSNEAAGMLRWHACMHKPMALRAQSTKIQERCATLWGKRQTRDALKRLTRPHAPSHVGSPAVCMHAVTLGQQSMSASKRKDVACMRMKQAEEAIKATHKKAHTGNSYAPAH